MPLYTPFGGPRGRLIVLLWTVTPPYKLLTSGFNCEEVINLVNLSEAVMSHWATGSQTGERSGLGRQAALPGARAILGRLRLPEPDFLRPFRQRNHAQRG